MTKKTKTQRATRKKSDVNIFTMRMHLHIFLMYIFYKRLNCDKGFYCLYKIQSICGFVSLQWLDGELPHLERETCYENIRAVLCYVVFPLK